MKSSTQFSFKSKAENLVEIRKFTEDFLVVNGVSLDDIEKIILAIDEACTNKIKHAYKNNPSKEIIIKLELSNNLFTAQIVDFGIPFEPDKVPLPDIDHNYKSSKKGGYGIFLMKKLMDEVNYEFLDSGENILTLKKFVKLDSNG